MPAITQSAPREIVEDFAEEIRIRKMKTAKPSKEVINFRNEMADNFERDVVQVPIDLLRYRKENGRIASDLSDYENTYGVLDESEDEAQAVLRKFLESKDPEKTSTLMKNILHSGQRAAAIITCDGFLINGNRRKMVMQRLREERPNDESFAFLKVVILPGKDEEGGSPTLIEIEKLENRYQLQSEGKSEYYGFDRALSVQRKIRIGLSLKEQVSDDPQYSGATQAEINKAIKNIERDYLNPLKCVDRYLRQFQREGQYRTISTGMSDKQGRWQAFIDYSNTYSTKFTNSNFLIESGIEDDEIGEIEEAAFDIIRLRIVPDMPKVHKIMRDFHRYCSNREGKKEILNISGRVEPMLPSVECYDDGDEQKLLERHEIDAKWAAKNKQTITFHLKKASKSYESQKEKETPIGLLEAALKKLTHKEMDLTEIDINDYGKARELAAEIQRVANELEGQIYAQGKNLKKLTNKGK